MAQTQAPQPVAPAAEASQAEIQRMLRDEIEGLRRTLDQRFAEIETLTRRLEAPDTTAAATAAAALEQRLAAQETRHRLEITLLHRLYASWHSGPATGVLPFAAQAVLLEGAPLFDEAWYIASYPDVKDSGFSAREHYVRSGAFEGRNPGPGFDTMAYYLANPDVAAAGWPALVHYMGFGKAEGRRIG